MKRIATVLAGVVMVGGAAMGMGGVAHADDNNNTTGYVGQNGILNLGVSTNFGTTNNQTVGVRAVKLGGGNDNGREYEHGRECGESHEHGRECCEHHYYEHKQRSCCPESLTVLKKHTEDIAYLKYTKGEQDED